MKATAVVDAPAQTVWLLTAFTVGIGFTVIVNVSFTPGQPLAVGVTINVSTLIVVPVVPTKLAIFPGLVEVLPIAGPETVHV